MPWDLRAVQNGPGRASVLDQPGQMIDRRAVGHRALSVVIPCFNEEHRIVATLEHLVAFLAPRGEPWEIVAVDDGSADGTTRVIHARFGDEPHVRTLRYPSNHGKGWALCEGFRAATGDAVLFTDADLATPIEELPRFLACLDAGYHIVVGSRVASGANVVVRQPFQRRLSGAVFRGLVRFLGLTGVHDTQCGFKLMQRTPVAPLLERATTIGFAFDVELLTLAERAGLRVAELPVEWHDIAGSKIRLWPDAAHIARDVIRLRRRLGRAGHRPSRPAAP
jgi:dolichyl-phosphate beta-glucosyltransferase